MRLNAVWLALSVATAGCTTLSQQQCLRGDWRVLGFEDGVEGRPPDRLDALASECARYGVYPDVHAWRLGYRDGLESYCTAHGGFRAGMRRATYHGVCTGPSAGAFLNAYADGLAVSAARRSYYEATYGYGAYYDYYYDYYHYHGYDRLLRVRKREPEPPPRDIDPEVLRGVARGVAGAITERDETAAAPPPAAPPPRSSGVRRGRPVTVPPPSPPPPAASPPPPAGSPPPASAAPSQTGARVGRAVGGAIARALEEGE